MISRDFCYWLRGYYALRRLAEAIEKDCTELELDEFYH